MIIQALARSLPISALLSQALVAFTIACDNESERRMPHRTTDHGPAGGGPLKPWLISLAMWCNCLQHVPDEGLTVRALEAAARTKTNLNGMERWGYITVTREGREQRVRATPAGRMAQGIWRRLPGEIEDRWTKRFGAARVRELRDALVPLVAQFDVDLPDCVASRSSASAKATSARASSACSEAPPDRSAEAWRTRFGGQTMDAICRALEAIVRPDVKRSSLFEGLTPCPECWRARVPPPSVLPHFPMVLHRGGYPDGS